MIKDEEKGKFSPMARLTSVSKSSSTEGKNCLLNSSINQLGAVLFSIADHDFPHISIPHHFQCFCHSSYFESPSNIFWCCFGTIIPVVTRFCTFSLLLTCPKKVAWRLLILFMLNLVVLASCNSFGWFLYSPWDTNLILFSPVSFVTVLKLCKLCIDTSEWVQ